MQTKKILTFVSDMWEDKKIETIAKASAIPGFLWAHNVFLAATSGGGDIKIVNNLAKTASNVYTAISTAYCNSICWLLFMVELLVFAFSKDEKKIALSKKCFIGCLIAYVLFKIIGTNGGVLSSSLDKISEWMGN